MISQCSATESKNRLGTTISNQPRILIEAFLADRDVSLKMKPQYLFQAFPLDALNAPNMLIYR